MPSPSPASPSTPARWSTLPDAGNAEGARTALRELFEAGSITARHAAQAAESVGDTALALRAWQLVVRDFPEDAGAWAGLALLHDARGDETRANACRLRAGIHPGSGPAPSGDRQGPDGRGATGPAADEPVADSATDADLLRFCALFAGREGVHARMWRGSPESGTAVGYSPVEQSLTPDLLRQHLAGDQTLGVYLVRIDNTVTCCCFDLDVTKRAIQDVLGDAERTRVLRAELAAAGIAFHRRLRELGLDPLFVDSGWKGRHFWCFLPKPMPAGEVLAWGTAMVAALRPESPNLSVEFFPKQAAVSQEGGRAGLGNLVKLPLGLHLASQRRAVVLDEGGQPLSDPWPRLRSMRRVGLPSPPVALPPLAYAPRPDVAPFSPAPGVGDFTEAELESSPEVGPVFRGCAVVRSIIEQTLRDRRITRDEAVVLEHSIGHGPDGVRAVNYVFDRVPGMAAELKMGSPHRGSPVSCQRVRQRVPDHARKVGCDCPFTPRPGEYANPLLHRTELRPAKPDPTLDDMLERLARAEDRLRTLQAEVQVIRAGAARRLRDVPGRRWAVRGGEWTLLVDGTGDGDGVFALKWVPEGTG